MKKEYLKLLIERYYKEHCLKFDRNHRKTWERAVDRAYFKLRSKNG